MTTALAPQRIHRPYARIRKKRERSVTEILDRKAIPGLHWAAAKITAEQAVYTDEWRDLQPEQAVDYLRRHFKGVWDGRAAVGTACHKVLEGWGNGDTVDLYDIVADLAENDYAAKRWQGNEDAVVAQIAPYVDGLALWWKEHRPSGGVAEECVRTPGVYLGQRDRWRVSVKKKAGVGGIDLKTTAQSEPEKGVYLESWTLQLNAYDRADECVDYAEDDQGRIVELGTRPNERVDWLGVIHLRGDGLYHFYEIDNDDKHFDAFLSLAGFNRWALGMEKAERKEIRA